MKKKWEKKCFFFFFFFFFYLTINYEAKIWHDKRSRLNRHKYLEHSWQPHMLQENFDAKHQIRR